MSKKVVIFIIFVLLVIFSLSYIKLKPKSNTQHPHANQSPAAPLPEANGDNNGTYTTYTEGIIDQTPRKKILFFHAPWCPQCRAIEADILRDGVPTGMHIIKVDYDSNQDLRQKYGVTIQTTFVELGDNGDSIEKFVAYDQPTLKAVVLNFTSK